MEALRKRCLFLEAAEAAAGVANVSVVWARAEDAGRLPEHREAYDVATARAVADMRVLAELCLPLVRVGGVFVAAKGPSPQDEVRTAEAAIELLGGSRPQIVAVVSASPDGQRTAVCCRKERATPEAYPRPPGRPAKRPL